MLYGWLPDKKDIQTEWKKKLTTLIVAGITLYLVGWKDEIFDAYKFKKDFEENKKIVSVCDSLIDYKTIGEGAPTFFTGMFNSPWMLEYKQKEHEAWRKKEFHVDSAKAKLSTYLVVGTGMNDQAMKDTIVSMINWYSKEKANTITEKKFKFNFAKSFKDEMTRYKIVDGQLVRMATF